MVRLELIGAAFHVRVAVTPKARPQFETRSFSLVAGGVRYARGLAETRSTYPGIELSPAILRGFFSKKRNALGGIKS